MDRPTLIALSDQRPTLADADADGLVLTWWPKHARGPLGSGYSTMAASWLTSEAAERRYLDAVAGIPVKPAGSLPTHWCRLPAEPGP